MENFLAIANALSDRTRLRLLLSLRDCELCVCELVEFSSMADSTVSRHMSILKSAGLVDARKSGRWVYYKLSARNEHSAVGEILNIVRRFMADDPQAIHDATLVAEILERGRDNACADIATAESTTKPTTAHHSKQLEHQE